LKRLLQIELNEFDPDFLREQAERLSLKNIQKMLAWPHSNTWTDDEVEHQGLDPWVQWVSIHTGLPSQQHGIKRLGDTKYQTREQTWNRVGELGFDWGAWGVMNAPAGDLSHCDVFMPDPWSFEESPYPEKLSNLLALPRYMARNYLDPSKIQFLLQGLKLVRYFMPPSHWPTVFKLANQLAKSAVSPGVNLHSLTTLLDYLATLEFVRYRKTSTAYNVIFLNHIAHLQHQFWKGSNELHPEMRLGLAVCDLTIGLLIESVDDDDAIMIVNGLKQKNVEGDGIFVYRQINPEMAMSTLLGDLAFQLDQCMTNDAHLHFDSVADTDQALSMLSSAKLCKDELQLLFCERMGPKHIFSQLMIEREVEQSEQVSLNDGSRVRFYDIFETVCERTGAHVQEGDIFARGIRFPDKLYNHEISAEVIEFFQRQAALKQENQIALEAV